MDDCDKCPDPRFTHEGTLGTEDGRHCLICDCEAFVKK